MKQATVKVTWTPSPSDDVVVYKVLVMNETDQVVVVDKTVSKAETSVLFDVLASTALTATVVANDGIYDSTPVSASFVVDDLTAPMPVGEITFEVVSIADIPDPAPVDPVDPVDPLEPLDPSGV